MDAYRNELEAAAGRILALEERVREHRARLRALRSDVNARDDELAALKTKLWAAAPAGAIRRARRALAAVLLVGAVAVTLAAYFAVERSSLRRALDSQQAANRAAWSAPLLADPTPGHTGDRDAYQPAGDDWQPLESRLRAKVLLGTASADEIEALDVLEALGKRVTSLRTKVAAVLSLAEGTMSLQQLSFLRGYCTLDGDVRCRRLVAAELSRRGLDR